MQMICIKENKIKIKKILPLLALNIALVGCNGNNNENIADENTQMEPSIETIENAITEENNKTSNEGVVYTSIFPIYNLTKQIAGDKFEVKSFVNLKTESHGWEPSARDLAELSNASVLFINGAGMEDWEESVDDTVDVDIVETVAEVDLIEANNNHDQEDEDHDHGMYDPHTWLSPVNGKAQAKTIADKLAEIDPANVDYYMTNYQKIADQLDAIIAEYQDKFLGIENKNFLVTHAAFSYLARDFGLNQIALTSLMSTAEADAKTIKDVVNEANAKDITTIFYEKGGSDKTAQTVASEIGGDIQALNTMEFATDEELENNITYQELVKENLEAIYNALIN